jgi:hypothetical protein
MLELGVFVLQLFYGRRLWVDRSRSFVPLDLCVIRIGKGILPIVLNHAHEESHGQGRRCHDIQSLSHGSHDHASCGTGHSGIYIGAILSSISHLFHQTFRHTKRRAGHRGPHDRRFESVEDIARIQRERNDGSLYVVAVGIWVPRQYTASQNSTSECAL